MSAEPPNVVRTWIVPLIIGSSMMMYTLNATVVYNALPTMAEALDEDLLHMNLVVTMFMLAATVFMPISAWVADRFGARLVFTVAVAMFAISSAACGLAQDLTQLIVARVAQGIAGAMMLPVGRLVLLRSTPKNELVSAMSVLTLPAMLGPVLGPLIGGAMVTFADWRWIFYMNLPIALAGVFLIRAYVPDVEPEEDAGAVDWLGVALTTVGLAGLIFAVENLGRELVSPVMVAAMFAVAVVCLGGYWAHARGRANAIIDLSLFRVQTFSAAVIGGGFLRVGLATTPFLLAMLLQVCFGMDAFTAGIIGFIAGAAGLMMKTVAPPILRRYGFRVVLIVNGLLVGVSFIACALLGPTTPQWVIMAVVGIGGFFRSLQFTSLNALVFADLEQHQMSRGSATSSMAQQLVQAIGIGLSATLLQVLMQLRGETKLTTPVLAWSFLIVGVVMMVSFWWFVRLPPTAGEEMHSGPRRPDKA